MQQLEVAADRREQQIQQLQAAAEQRRREQLARQWTLPVSSYRLTGLFGQSSYLWSTVHTGLDFAAPEGTPIYSVGAGTVTEAGYAGSYGYRTIVTLADGTEIWYCHQSSISVTVGSAVSRGQVVGLVGSTGNVTGPHLHLEVRPEGGDPVDPYTALVQRGAQP
ncbi:M23 family metallopeptidase [Nocardioides allogilvus]|nr:peptidase M23B [Nocardioides sp. CF8]